MDDQTLERVRAQLSKVKVPSSYDRVFKDECMYSFATAESDGGLFVSLHDWHGVGARFLDLHHERSGGVLYYLEKTRRVPLSAQESAAQEAAPTKMAIGGDHGFQVDKKDYKLESDSFLVIMPDRTHVALPCPQLPELILNAIRGIQVAHCVAVFSAALAYARRPEGYCASILQASTLPYETNEGASRQAQTAAWEEERRESKYARSLEQLPPERKISPNTADWKCDFTGVTDNLWLNLSTGKIGSGRRQWDGSGGNGAALRHFEETGRKYPLVVKLGTITPHGADVYSYAPDEDDLVTDPLLVDHLKHWGINMMEMEKTVKTMAELQIDMNVKFEYNAITEGGQDLQPAFGAHRVGLENHGNYCYMSSTLQALFGIPLLDQTYSSAAERLFRSAPADVALDFPSQLAKVGAALVTGQTDRPTPGAGGHQATLPQRIEANAVSPHRFKALIGRNHLEFGSSHQQDACEFFQYLLEVMTRAERASASRVGPGDGPPCSALFCFNVEHRTQCASTGAVSYKQNPQNTLSLDIPLDAATNKQEVAEYREREEKRKELQALQADAYIGAEAGNGVVASEEESPVTPRVPLEACLAKFAAETSLSDYYSPALGAKGAAVQTQLIASFPPYLMLHLRKYYVDEQWRARKMDVLAGMPHSLNLEHLRAKGPQPTERMQPEEAASAPAGTAPPAEDPKPDPAIVSMLSSAGFGEHACARAALAVNNSDAEAAMNWLLSHMEDADINDPLPSSSVRPASAPSADGGENGGAVDPAHVEMLTSMGFTERQVKAALQECSNSVERAADWLFSRTDDLDAAVAAVEGKAAETSASPVSAKQEVLDGEGKYELVAIISHIGSNTACGHYVAHVKKFGQWYIYNDEKVALSERLPIEHGYMYLYRRLDQPWT